MIKRFDTSARWSGAGIVETPDGYYVRYADYERLRNMARTLVQVMDDDAMLPDDQVQEMYDLGLLK